jgi:hypothetical protein
MVDYGCPLGFILDGADDHEVELRIRELRILAALVAGWQSPAKLALDKALADRTRAPEALQAIDALPARLRRSLLSNWGAIAYGPVKNNGREPSGGGRRDREVCPLCKS